MSATTHLQKAENDTYTSGNVDQNWFIDGTINSDVTLDVTSVWADYTGRGVQVAVIDSQINYKHSDLNSGYDQNLDYNFDLQTDEINVDPRAMSDWHGTEVAGVIAAEPGNNIGGVGIAHGATLVGYAINYSSAAVADQVLQALSAATDVDVVNNSWSFNQNFYDNFNVPDNASMGETLEEVAEQGRDGLGTVMVFSAGNGGNQKASNYHNFQNSPYTIAVGAIEADGSAWEPSSVGANVLVSAAGHDVYTTTRRDGHRDVDGTSYAAPAVSSVVALMLEANPNLGYRDVQQILALSAERGPLSDTAPNGLGWQTNGSDGLNGGGMQHSDTFGFGVVNAHNAVRLAETWTEQQTAQNRETVTVEKQVNERLIAGTEDYISVDIEVDEDIDLEHVELTMGVAWRFSGDLDVYLTSPEGTRVQLVYENDEGNFNGNLRNFTFSSVATMGESGAGTWTLEIFNRNPDALDGGAPMEGRLFDVRLELHGDTDGLNNDLYVYTDEFGTIYSESELAERSTLADTNGGIDTINAAAVTSNSRIDLSGTGNSEIAGQNLIIETPGSIENVHTGDGDDTVSGNDLDNTLSTGRGDDVVVGSAGNDVIDGGEGEDKFVVGADFGGSGASLLDTGAFLFDMVDAGLSTVFGFEVFQFDDVTYSASELEARVPTGTEPPADPEPDPAPGVDPDPDPPAPDFDAELTGTSDADRLNGTNANDRIEGFAGNDTIKAGQADDAVFGGDGHDKLLGQGGDDHLRGEAGSDNLKGGDGDDTLDGGAGRDKLFGGDGADVFVFDLGTPDEVDVVRDFNAAEGDQIQVTGLSEASQLSFVESNGHVFVEVTTGEQTVRLARIDDTSATDLSVAPMSDHDAMIF
ncbi:MAG: S8 family serine peptidase [Pseudomonadota bacterium]